MAKGIRALLDTVMQALPQVGNLGLLFYLLFFIFAALGVELFGRLGQWIKFPHSPLISLFVTVRGLLCLSSDCVMKSIHASWPVTYEAKFA